MKVDIKATNIELNDTLRDYIQQKMNMLDKYMGDLDAIHCDFEIEKTTDHHRKGEIYRAEINLSVPGDLLRVDKTTKDLYKAIDKVKDHMVRVIVRFKKKKQAIARRNR